MEITRKKPVLKLVHPGGILEKHKKPITAAEVMERNPRHFVTRTDVFKYPWVVVRPESLLHPGDVFYVVPFHTIRGLLRRKARQYQFLSQQQSPNSRSSEDFESKCARELLRKGSYPYDPSPEGTKIVKRRSPNACQNTERCRLCEYFAGNLKSPKKHCLDQLGESLRQRQQGHDSPFNEGNKLSSRHRVFEQFLEGSCTNDSSNEMTHAHDLLKSRPPDARQYLPSYKLGGYTEGDRRSVHPVGHHQSLRLTPAKQHLDLHVGKNFPDGAKLQTRVTSEKIFSPAKPSRPKYIGGDYHPRKNRQSFDPCLKMKNPMLEEPDSGNFGCQPKGGPSQEQYLEKPRNPSDSFTFWAQSEAERQARDSEGWHESSSEEDRFHWLQKSRPLSPCQDVENRDYGGAEIKNLGWGPRVHDGPHSPSDDKENGIFQRDGTGMKLDQSRDDVFRLKSCLKKTCLKKKKNRVSGRRVRFTLPGEDDDNLRGEVFEFQDEESP